MPKTTKKGTAKQDELPDAIKRSDAKAAQRTFAKAHDSAGKEYGEGQRAHRVAYGAPERTHKKVGDHWESKDKGGKGPSDAQSKGGRDTSRESAGGVDGNPSQKHLYELAKEIHIPGPFADEQGRTRSGPSEGQQARDRQRTLLTALR